MPRRPLWTLLAPLCMLLSLAVGCAPAPLARPAILGASASAGFGCEIAGPPPESKAYLADMEAVYQASVPGWHSDPLFLADASFYSRPRESAVEQMDAALAHNPSIIVAIDYLFWSVYGGRDASKTADEVERDRHDALEQALAQLDRFQGPVIVGDIPDMSESVGRMLSQRNIPPAAQLEAFNRRIVDWASHRKPESPAIVLPIAALARAVQSSQPVHTSSQTFDPSAAGTLLQPDRLHPTALGLAVMLREGFSGMADRGLIARDGFRSDLADITARLPDEAASIENRREPGLWTLLSLRGKRTEFNQALEKKDCAAASDVFDQVMEKVSRMRTSPHEFADVFVAFTLMNYRMACGDSVVTIRRWRDRLAPAIERPLPDPWPLELWGSFNRYTDDEQLTIERMLRLKREHTDLNSAYKEIMRDAAREARFSNPAAYIELLPSWKSELDRNISIAEQIADFWTKRSKQPEWAKEVEHQYNSALAWAGSEEERQKIAARRSDFEDPKIVITKARAMTLESIATLERALRLTGHTDEAAAVHARLADLVDAEEAKGAYERVEKEAAEALAEKKTKP